MRSPEHDKFLCCAKCEEVRPDGETMQSFARLSVAVTVVGALLVRCVRHNVVIAHIPNNKIAEELANIALSGCEGDDKKETMH